MRGTIPFVVGLVCLALTSLPISALVLDLRHSLGPFLLGLSVALFLSGINMLAIGLYRSLRHSYSRVSQMDRATDRPVRGGPVCLFGLFSLDILVVLAGFSLVLAEVHRNQVMVQLVVLMSLIASLICMLLFAVGLLWMARDLFLRIDELRRLRQHGDALRIEREPGDNDSASHHERSSESYDATNIVGGDWRRERA